MERKIKSSEVENDEKRENLKPRSIPFKSSVQNQFPMIKQLIIAMILFSSAIEISQVQSKDFQYAEDLAIDDEFGQEKGFSRIIAQPDQNFKLEIDSYFRGQFLRYNLTGMAQTEQILVDEGVITINSAVEETNRLALSQSPNPMASFYTESIFYLEQTDGNPPLNYFFFIDQSLNLIAYDITNYATKFSPISRKPVVQINLYDPKQLSSFKSCSHLLQIGNNYVVTVCQAASDKNGTIVFTQFGSGKSSGLVQYMNSSISYKEIMNGRLRLLDFDIKSMSVDLILLRNKSSNFFEIISLDIKQQKAFMKALIKNITYPNFSMHQGSISFQIVAKPQIQDVRVITQQKGLILLSEYTSGMFILNISCNRESCDAKTQSIVSYPNSGGLQLLKVLVNDILPNALASMVQPPTILEINIQDSFNPYIARKYVIKVDEDDYLGLNVLDADERFIVFAILRIDDFRPFLRVYDRQETFSSFAISQFEIQNYYFDDVYISFLLLNYFVVRTSEFLQIFRIQPPSIQVSTHNLQSLIEGKNLSDVYQRILLFQMSVQDNKEASMNRTLEMIILPESANYTVSTVPTLRENQTLKSDKIYVNYNCGKLRDLIQDNIQKIKHFTLLRLDSYFSGPVESMNVINMDEENDISLDTKLPGLISNPWIQNSTSNKDCTLNSLISYTIDYDLYYCLICFSQDNFTITMRDIIESENYYYKNKSVSSVMQPFHIPALNMSQFLVDSNNSNVYVFSEKNRYGEQKLTMHILKLANQLQWMDIIRIGEDFEDLVRGFSFSSLSPISFNSRIQLGVIKSVYNKTNGSYRLLTFKINQLGDDYQFELRACLDFKPQASASPIEILKIQVTDSQKIWLQLSNSSIIVYQHEKNYTLLGSVLGLNQTLQYQLTRLTSLQFESHELHLQSIEIAERQVIVFLGQNIIRVFNLVDQTNEFTSNMTLQLSYENNQLARVSYEFTFDEQNKLLYTRHGRLLIVLMNDKDSGEYFLNCYNTQTTRHNSLYLQMNIEPGFIVKGAQFIDMYHIEISTTKLKLVLINENMTLLYEFDLSYKLTIDSTNAKKLDEYCKGKSEQLSLSFLVYPKDNQDQSTQIEIRAKNNGLVVTTAKTEYHMAVQLSNNPITYGNFKVDGSLNLNNFFQGFNMWYNITSNDHDGKLPSEFMIETIVEKQPEVPLEFLTNKNKLLDLTTLGQFILILDVDGYFIVTKQIQASYYERVLAESIIGCHPTLFTMFYDNYFLFQCNESDGSMNKIQFGVTKFFDSEPSEYLKDRSLFYGFFGGDFLIKRVSSHMQVTKRIDQCQIYISDEDNLFLTQVFDIPDQNFVSIVEFYSVSFIKGTTEVEIKYFQDTILTATLFGFDQLKITSIQLVPQTSLLTIGVSNYGIIVYDIMRQMLIQSINLRRIMRYQEFKVQQIIEDGTQSLYLIMNILGIIQIRINNLTNFESEIIEDTGFHVHSYFNFLEGETYQGKQYAKETEGFAFITRQELQVEDVTSLSQAYNLRYFSFNNDDNSKLLAYRQFDQGLNCQAIRYYPFQYALQYFKVRLPHNNYAFFGLQCDTELNFYLFTRTFSLYFLHDASGQLTGGEVGKDFSLQVVAYNDYTKEETTLNVSVMSQQSNSVPPAFYYLFVAVMAASLLVFQLVFKAHIKSQMAKNEIIELKKRATKQSQESEKKSQYYENVKRTLNAASIKVIKSKQVNFGEAQIFRDEKLGLKDYYLGREQVRQESKELRGQEEEKNRWIKQDAHGRDSLRIEILESQENESSRQIYNQLFIQDQLQFTDMNDINYRWDIQTLDEGSQELDQSSRHEDTQKAPLFKMISSNRN